MKNELLIERIKAEKERLQSLLDANKYVQCGTEESMDLHEVIDDILLTFKSYVYNYDKDCPIAKELDTLPTPLQIYMCTCSKRDANKVFRLMDKFIWYLSL